MSGPQRIVCLTEEPTEVLYALGEQQRIVGISGFTVRPAIARREKPKVSAFTSAKIGEILKLQPDFVVGFSDIQADIAAELIRNGVEVWISNHRSVAGILDYVVRLGALVGAGPRAQAYADGLRAGLDDIERASAALPRRPKVYFEEWDEPPITGIRWVAELIRIAGGRQEVPSGQGRCAPGLAGESSGARRRAPRGEVPADPAARTGGADRWSAGNRQGRAGLGNAVTLVGAPLRRDLINRDDDRAEAAPLQVRERSRDGSAGSPRARHPAWPQSRTARCPASTPAPFRRSR